MNLRIAAISLLAVLACVPALARAAVAPTVSQADGVTVIQQQDSAAPLVNVTLVVRAGLDRQTMAQNGLAALSAQAILRTPVDGVPVEEAIAAHGGQIGFAVDPDDVRFSIESLPDDANTVLGLARRALISPTFDAKSVSDARSALETRIGENQHAALQVGLDMLSGTLSTSANAGLPAYGIPASLAQFGPADARAFYSAFYHRGGSFVSAVGRIDALSPGSLDMLAQTLPAGETRPVVVAVPKLEGTSRQLVTHRDVSAPWLIAQYSAPPIGSKDFGAMLVLSSFMQRTLADIAEVPGVVSPTLASRAVGALYQYDRAQPNLTLYVNGGIGNPNRAFATALSIASILAATKLEGSIDDFKALAAGDFVNGATSLESRAWLAVIFAKNGTSPDYVARTLQAISSTNAADLQRVARQYLGNPTIALVLPRDKS